MATQLITKLFTDSTETTKIKKKIAQFFITGIVFRWSPHLAKELLHF